jgi:hypothetical protein
MLLHTQCIQHTIRFGIPEYLENTGSPTILWWLTLSLPLVVVVVLLLTFDLCGSQDSAGRPSCDFLTSLLHSKNKAEQLPNKSNLFI